MSDKYYALAMRFKHAVTPSDLSHYLPGETYYYSAVGQGTPDELVSVLLGPAQAYPMLIRLATNSPFIMNVDQVDVSGVQTFNTKQLMMDYINAGSHADVLVWTKLT